MSSKARKEEPQTHRERYEESWIRKLQTIPDFRIICERLLAGAPVARVAREVATWEQRGECQDINSETLRKYHTALNIRIQRRKREGQTALARILKHTMPSPNPSEVAEAMVDVVTADKVAQYIWDKHVKHVDRLEAMEEKFGIPLSNWDRSMDVLNNLLDILIKKDIAAKVVERGMPMQTQTQPLSPMAEKLKEFSEVDRQLMRSAYEKMKVILEQKVADESAKTEEAEPVGEERTAPA